MTRHLVATLGACVLHLTTLGSLSACFTASSTTAATTAGSRHAACDTADFAAVRLQKQVRPSIVRIESDIAGGTGFVIKHSGDGILIATNFHVVRGGSRFDAVFDSGGRLGNLEVVKTDSEHDLALLHAPGFHQAAPGLQLSSQGVALGEHVAAIGYPHVDGESEPSLTFEDGGVTNTRTELEGHTYIRTNANINHGNSGGPVIDACGQVVGIVVAMLTETKRTGLIIPVSDLKVLLAIYDRPRGTREAEVESRIRALETAARYKRGPEVAAMFSRHMLAEQIMPAFESYVKKSLASAEAKVNEALVSLAESGKPVQIEGHTITNVSAVPTELRYQLIAKVLDPAARASFLLVYMMNEKQIDPQTAMVRWLGGFAHGLFGQDPTFKLDGVIFKGKTLARSEIRVGSSALAQFWTFDWVYEWGDWRIDDYRCERGCS